jgi:transformation/transcription domain-associated protein
VEIRDGIEIVHSSEYINFLKHFFPAFAELLSNTPLASEDGPAHRLRNVVLEVLSRMPQNEVRLVRPRVCHPW